MFCTQLLMVVIYGNNKIELGKQKMWCKENLMCYGTSLVPVGEYLVNSELNKIHIVMT